MIPRQIKLICYVIIPLAALGLFLNKPFHMDDVVFLRMADLLPYHLLGTTTGTIEWNGKIYQDLSPYESSHPPGIALFLKWLSLLQPSGDISFWRYHAGFLLFPLLTLWAGRRYAPLFRVPRWWAWFLILSPGFFVNAGNLMTDAATATFWTLTVLATHAYSRQNRTLDLTLAVLSLTAALMCAWQSIALLPLIAVQLLLRARVTRRDLGFVAPPVLMLIYVLIIYQMTGFFPYLAHTVDYNIAGQIDQGLRQWQLHNKGFSILVNLGFCLFFIAPLLFLESGRTRVLPQLASAFGIYWFLYMRMDGMGRFDNYAGLEVVALKLLAFTGVFFLVTLTVTWAPSLGAAARRLRKGKPTRSPGVVLGFWCFGVLFYNWTMMPFGSPRYLLPALAPALLLILPRLTASHRRLLVPLAVLTLAASSGCAALDYQHARGRYQVYTELMSQIDDPQLFWFNDEFALNRYFNQSGCHYLPDEGVTPPAGATVLITRDPEKAGQRPGFKLVRVIELPSKWGLALYQPQHGAGFYCSYDGLLPLNRAPFLERLYLFKVEDADSAANNP